MENKVFPQMNTLVKIRETTLLSKQQKLELINAENIETALNILNGTSFFTFSHPTHLHELESTLETEKRYYLKWSKEMAPGIPIAEIFEVPDLIHNIKVFLREQISSNKDNVQNELAYLYLNLECCDNFYFNNLLKTPKTELSNTENCIKTCIENAISDYAIHNSFLRTDLILMFFGHVKLLELSEKVDNPKISDFIKTYVDLNLLSILFQIREIPIVLNKSIISKARTGNLKFDPELLFSGSVRQQDELVRSTLYSEFWASLKDKTAQRLSDVYIDNYLLNICKQAKLEAFGVFPLFAFLYAKMLDIKNVRLIFSLKKNNANKNEIEERLREKYEL